MQTITSPPTTPTTASAGVAVGTAISAGAMSYNHSEGIVVRTAITAGGRLLNHSETVVQPGGSVLAVPPPA